MIAGTPHAWGRRVGVAALIALLAGIALLWARSLVPGEYSVMGMGQADFGGGPVDAVHAAHGSLGWLGPPITDSDVSVADLRGPDGPADASFTLVATAGTVRLADGRRSTGYLINGRSPGPALEARQGDLVEVVLVNGSVEEGVSLHWHGVDVPNGEDGVAGVTQDAVLPGGRHTYRFLAEDIGTFWYHSHQVSDPQVKGGLFGSLVVHPQTGAAVAGPVARGPGSAVATSVAPRLGTADRAPVIDETVLLHNYAGIFTLGGNPGEGRREAEPGTEVRIRLINTDNSRRLLAVAGAPYTVLAIDGRDMNGGAPVRDRDVALPAGGRYDLGFTVPADGAVRIGSPGRTASLVVGPAGRPGPPLPRQQQVLDPLHYGTPGELPFDPDSANRRFEVRIGSRLGFLDGWPGRWWTVNGGLWPRIPMYVVAEGDIVRFTVINDSGDVHPMHLHGHHAVVLARDGEAATGSPWWVDSLDVLDGERVEIAFVADNPGVWMDHCHQLAHAGEGLVAHLAYVGVGTPFTIGGAEKNDPE